MYVDIFQSDSRRLLRCRRSSLPSGDSMYSDNAGVVLSVADVSLSSRLAITGSQLTLVVFSFEAALACHQQTRQF